MTRRFQIITERRHIMKLFSKAKNQKNFEFPVLRVQTSTQWYSNSSSIILKLISSGNGIIRLIIPSKSLKIWWYLCLYLSPYDFQSGLPMIFIKTRDRKIFPSLSFTILSSLRVKKLSYLHLA